MKTFCTRHLGCSAMLRFVLGDAAHVRTFKSEDGRYTFEFADPENSCPEIARNFFSEEGAIVANALALLESARDVHKTISAANANGGLWENPAQ